MQFTVEKLREEFDTLVKVILRSLKH